MRKLGYALAAVLVAMSGCSGSGSKDGTPGVVATHTVAGRTAMEAAMASGATDDFLQAAQEYSAAGAAVGSDPAATPAQLDEARFFGGLARVALLASPYSDLTADGLNDLGDLLDAFGFGGTRAERAQLDRSLLMSCTRDLGGFETCQLRPLGADSPRSSELVAFMAGRLAPELRAAAALLHGVSAGFRLQLRDGGRTIEVDRTDALVVEAYVHAMLAALDLLQAYDLDLDLDALQARTTPLRVQEFLAQHPTFGRLIDAGKVQASRGDALAAIEAYQAAILSLQAEGATDPDQSDDLFTIQDWTCSYTPPSYGCTRIYNPPEAIARELSDLQLAHDFVASAGPYRFDRGTAATADDVVVSPDAFFAGVDLRPLLPTVWDAGAGGDRPGRFPDPTFGGVLVAAPFDLNEDLDGDGAPDLLGGWTYFFAGYLQGRSFGGSLLGQPVELAFAPTGNDVTLSIEVWDPVTFTYLRTSYPGAYQHDRNALTLTFAPPLPNGTVKLVITADGAVAGWGFSALVDGYGAGDALLFNQWAWFWPQ